MRIAVLSGKGGTGKTVISVNLAAAAGKAAYIDCDVEEPNGHLFFKPEINSIENITVRIPAVDGTLCGGCRKCVEFCKFNALAYARNKVLVFEEVCHSCGGCVLLCPEKALTEKEKSIGSIHTGVSGDVTVCTGMMNAGEASGVPIIRRMLECYPANCELAIIDCPPGSACIVMESIRNADYCILAAEPTVFGVHNLSMVYDLVTLLHKPCGAVLNKCLDQENPSEEFCRVNGIKVLVRIPYDNELGSMSSNARIAVRESSRYSALFSTLLQTAVKEACHEAVGNP